MASDVISVTVRMRKAFWVDPMVKVVSTLAPLAAGLPARERRRIRDGLVSLVMTGLTFTAD